jgi:hypothetical protein
MNRPPNHEHLDNQMVKMEVNLDDISGEWLGYVMICCLNQAQMMYITHQSL